MRSGVRRELPIRFHAFHSAQCAALIAPYAVWLRIAKKRTAVRNGNALKHLGQVRAAEASVTYQSEFMAFHSAQCAALIAPYAGCGDETVLKMKTPRVLSLSGRSTTEAIRPISLLTKLLREPIVASRARLLLAYLFGMSRRALRGSLH